jgi:glycosyltransferase involved in cell wall biosynthesis
MGQRAVADVASAEPSALTPLAREITIVAHDIGPIGGMERVLSELIAGLRGLGHDVTVIARTCELPRGADVRFHRVRGPARPFLIAYPWFLLRGSLVVRRRRRGVVQATGGIVLAPVDVISVHYCHQVGPANPSRSSVLFALNIAIVRVAKRLAERLCFYVNRDATYVCVSEGVASEVREHYPRLAGRVMTIHNGVDTDRFTPGDGAAEGVGVRAQLDLPSERLLAVFVGSEWERKGLRAVLEALAAAPEWDLLVAGDGDERRYRELAADLGVESSVHFLGVRADVGALYAAANAFVLPTSYETFSLVTFEAAASGLPLLASQANGISELIEDGVNGYFVTRDGSDIARRLRALGADPDLRERLGAAARRSALAFSWGRTVQEHHELYESLAVA